MSKFKKKKGGDLPAISTASLPDIVFMLLFFFMVATVMRDNTLLVSNTLPAADQVQKLDKKDRVMYIYAGKPSARYQDKFGTQARIQLNDKFATLQDVAAFVLAEKASKRQELQNVLTTALKVDGDTKMGLISDIKQELRKVNALKINYTTRVGDYSQNLNGLPEASTSPGTDGPEGPVDVNTGLTVDSLAGRAFIVHDYNGVRIACALLEY
jgi:biopolymer transport protein ExbD